MIEVKMTMEERLNAIKDQWFLMDPGYFMVLCTHVVEFNPAIGCAMATGGGHIYINPEYFEETSDTFFEESLKIEIIRILLKHPYQRQLPNMLKMFISSNFVIANNTSFKEVGLKTTREVLNTYELDRECLEVIYDSLNLPELSQQQSMKQGGSGGQGSGNGQGSGRSGGGKGNAGQDQSNGKGDGNGHDNSKKGGNNGGGSGLQGWDDGWSDTDDIVARTQFWKEDVLKITEVNDIIGKIDKTKSWGSMPGNVVDTIKKSIEPKFNYRAVFQQFRSTVISSARSLTRMRPNRRFGYASMGSKREFTTKILVAVDNSGSISDDELALAMGFINNFFKYGIDQIDAIQFDHEIHPNTLQQLTKKMNRMKIEGRGGTDFNGVFEYAQKTSPVYDGVIIVTDGWACVPDKKWLSSNYRGTRYLWCLNNEENFKNFSNRSSDWSKFGKSTYVAKRENNN